MSGACDRRLQNSGLSSPQAGAMAASERESPFRKKIRMTTERPEVDEGTNNDEPASDNSRFLKGLQQLRDDSTLSALARGGHRYFTQTSTNKSPRIGNHQSPAGTYEAETDEAILARRAKQIDYGKTTREYSNYIKAISKDERQDFHPRTPNMKRRYSRRAWDGLIKQWRLNLHIWSDTPQTELDFSQNGVIRKRRIESGSDRTDSPDSSEVNFEDKEAESEVSREVRPSGLKKKASFTERIKAEAESFSTSWADEVEEYELELKS